MSQGSSTPDRAVWLAVMIIIAALIAAGAAFTFHLAHATPASTLKAAGSAFVATMMLAFAIWRFLTPPK
jgi:hypothetical protein